MKPQDRVRYIICRDLQPSKCNKCEFKDVCKEQLEQIHQIYKDCVPKKEQLLSLFYSFAEQDTKDVIKEVNKKGLIGKDGSIPPKEWNPDCGFFDVKEFIEAIIDQTLNNMEADK